MLPFALPFLPMLLGLGGALAYGEWQRKRGQDSSSSTPAATTDDAKTKIQTVYNYNRMNDSTVGRSLFNSPTASTTGSPTDPTLANKKRMLFQ